MIRFLPFILVAILILGGLGYWKFFAAKEDVEPAEPLVVEEPREVPATFPVSTPSPKAEATDTGLASKVTSLEVAVADLKSRISTLEKKPASTTTTQSSGTSKVPVYIPLGSGGSNSNTNWADMPGYEISIDPAEYDEYTSMKLEVNMRLNASGGNAMVRLTSSDGTAISSELSTPQTVYNLNTSTGFKLSSKKTYKLQVKSTAGHEMFIQDARIKVSF